MSLSKGHSFFPCAKAEHNACLISTDVSFGLNPDYAPWSPVLSGWSVACGAIVKPVMALKGGWKRTLKLPCIPSLSFLVCCLVGKPCYTPPPWAGRFFSPTLPWWARISPNPWIKRETSSLGFFLSSISSRQCKGHWSKATKFAKRKHRRANIFLCKYYNMSSFCKNQSSVSKQYILIISLTTYNQIIIIMIHLMNNKLVIFLISWM